MRMSKTFFGHKFLTGVLLGITLLTISFLLFSCSDPGITIVESPATTSTIATSPAPRILTSPALPEPSSAEPVASPSTPSTVSPAGDESPYGTIFGDPVTGENHQESQTLPAPSSPVPTVTVTVTKTPPTPEPATSPRGPMAVARPAPVDPLTGERPWIDLVFVIDCTGSMGDELEVIKTRIVQMVQEVSRGLPEPYVRYGIVAYRDWGDEFVTLRFDLTDDVREVSDNISMLYAAGGGDTPESVAEALHVAVHEIKWDEGGNSRKLIFLIGDAGPHENRPGDYDYRAVAREATRRNIVIYTVGCSGIEKHGLEHFRHIAVQTGGTFDYLTYRQQFRDTMEGTLWLIGGSRDRVALMDGPNDDHWKNGYSYMVASGKARVTNALSLGGIIPAGPLENNLDQYLVDRVKAEAQGMGVRYRD